MSTVHRQPHLDRPPVQGSRPAPLLPLATSHHAWLLFVGEQRSRTAIRRGYTWSDKRLCARTLADALAACGIAPEACSFLNVFNDAGALDAQALGAIRQWSRQGGTIIGLGRRVQRVFTQASIPFRAMVHPAAQGRIRQRTVYQAHVAEVLQELAGAVAYRTSYTTHPATRGTSWRHTRSTGR